MVKKIIHPLVALLTLVAFLLVATGMNRVVLLEERTNMENYGSNSLVDIPLEDQLEPQVISFLFELISMPAVIYTYHSPYSPNEFSHLLTPPPEHHPVIS